METSQDMKLKYFKIMVEIGLHEGRYLDVCKYNRAIFDTPSVQADDDVNTGWKQSLRNSVVFAVLAPYDNEQSDLVARISEEKKLADESLALYKELLKNFVTSMVMPWTQVDTRFGPDLKATSFFDLASEQGKKRYDDLRGQVVEHNIRVMAKYYTRISSTRLSQILELPIDEMEQSLAKLVEKKTIYAKINRPAKIITFRQPTKAAEVLEEWSSTNNSLMQLVSNAAHVIAKEKLAIANRA